MKKKNNIEIEHICLVLVILGVVFLAFLILQSNYRLYHTEMHGAPVWGRILRVDEPTGYMGDIPNSKVEYTIGDESFLSYTGELPKRYLNDSLIVIYDTTDVDYDKRLLELEKKRVAHRERKHFYDRFCRDD